MRGSKRLQIPEAQQRFTGIHAGRLGSGVGNRHARDSSPHQHAWVGVLCQLTARVGDDNEVIASNGQALDDRPFLGDEISQARVACDDDCCGLIARNSACVLGTPRVDATVAHVGDGRLEGVKRGLESALDIDRCQHGDNVTTACSEIDTAASDKRYEGQCEEVGPTAAFESDGPRWAS